MYLLDVCSLRKVPFSVEERVRLQPKLTCSAQKGGGGGRGFLLCNVGKRGGR